MPGFVWQGGNEIAARADLRRRGWRLVADRPGPVPPGPSSSGSGLLILVDGGHRAALAWRTPAAETASLRELRRWVLLFGIDNPAERAALLHAGLGDVLGCDFEFDEIVARARRVVAMATMLPRSRRHGPLRLELLARDGYVDGKRLGLHPREFALAWRLMEVPGQAVDKATLLRDVWQLDYTPETNSLAVHARRLRAKLEIAGLPGLVRTTAGGGYALAEPAGLPVAAGGMPPPFMLRPPADPPGGEEAALPDVRQA
ncbi:MAG: response regulator transcription factor [Sphingomonadales bacterium]|nr:response regulator transcription factor [Sphingomonadales bacterium]